MGDPVGVGPELAVKALASQRVRRASRPVIVGDLALLRAIAKRLKLRAPLEDEVISVSALKYNKLKAGKPTKETAEAMVSYIEEAVQLAKNKEADAIATAPINKEAALLAGFGFPGHTEFLAHLTDTDDFAMMLTGSRLKVVLVTIHEPIRRVPRLLNAEKIAKTIKIADKSLKDYFGIERPRLAVCGLNPHAAEAHGGEKSSEKSEEELFIKPAVEVASKGGILAKGPLSPDTVFYRAVELKEFDCVVCMYHDQGLIPLKLLHFSDAINVTLGLPIIRTSVDHGTAYDIAWKAVASEKSMIEAVVSAATMAKTLKGNLTR